VTEHPGECRDGVGAETGPLEVGPRDDIGHQDAHDTEAEPGALGLREPGTGIMLLYGFVDGFDEGADKGQDGTEEHQ
jgi:hypothetical protein